MTAVGFNPLLFAAAASSMSVGVVKRVCASNVPVEAKGARWTEPSRASDTILSEPICALARRLKAAMRLALLMVLEAEAAEVVLWMCQPTGHVYVSHLQASNAPSAKVL